MGRRITAAVLGMLCGLLSGLGFGLFLIQAAVLSPVSKSSAIVPVIGALLGLLVGFFGGRKRQS